MLSGCNRLLRAVIATEIEFYLHGAGTKFSPEQVTAIIREACVKDNIPLASVEQERGKDQYEIALLPSSDKDLIIKDTERFKVLLKATFADYSINVDFSAKPLPNEPGSGLHIHIHLEDDNEKNLFTRDGDEFSKILLYSIGGLFETMNANMAIFAPNQASYLRFTDKSNAPTTVSWGTNNRTVAIRLPDKPMDNKHIEHRVSGSDADIASVIEAILSGIEYGIANKCNPGAPIYGDASLPQYALPKLARSLEEARSYREESKLLFSDFTKSIASAND